MTKPDTVVSKNVAALADAILALNWNEMTMFSEGIVRAISGLRSSERLDRDGMAQVLHEMAEEVREAQARAALQEKPRD